MHVLRVVVTRSKQARMLAGVCVTTAIAKGLANVVNPVGRGYRGLNVPRYLCVRAATPLVVSEYLAHFFFLSLLIGVFQMALNLDKSAFAAKFNKAVPPAAQEKSQLWLNIGYTAEGVTDSQGQPVFVSLARGIALDQVPDQPTNSSNQEFAYLRAAQNDLRDQLLAVAAKLEPGQTTTVTLEVQIRHVNGEPTIDLEKNPLAKKLFA